MLCHYMIPGWSGVWMCELNCFHHTRVCWWNFLEILKLVFDVRLGFCCLTSVCVRDAPSASFHASPSICPLLPVCPPVTVGRYRLPHASWLTDWSSHCLSDATATAPFWTLCVCVCRHAQSLFCKVSTYVAGAADESLTVAIVFIEKQPLCWFH